MPVGVETQHWQAARAYADQMGALFMETSAKSGHNVGEPSDEGVAVAGGGGLQRLKTGPKSD